MSIQTSRFIKPGQIYTRSELREAFAISAASLNNGIFRPSGHDSVWIFVTERKTPDRVQYVDHLDGQVLTFDSQSRGATDRLTVNHVSDGRELLVFHRMEKNEHPGSGFRYQGPFEYFEHAPGSVHNATPSVFTLKQRRD